MYRVDVVYTIKEYRVFTMLTYIVYNVDIYSLQGKPMSSEKTKIVSARITEEQFSSLESLAKKRGVSTSNLLNDCINKLIGGEIKPSVGTVTEEVLQEHLSELKRELLEELKKEQADHPKRDLNEKAKPKSQPSTPSAENGISARQLAKRLGCDHKTLTRWKEKGNDYLAERTRERDPEGKAWVFDEQTKMYVQESDGV